MKTVWAVCRDGARKARKSVLLLAAGAWLLALPVSAPGGGEPTPSLAGYGCVSSRSVCRRLAASAQREPLFAAWVVALCPDPAVVRRHAPAILEAIGRYHWDRLYLSQFFAAESAYYRLQLSGLV